MLLFSLAGRGLRDAWAGAMPMAHAPVSRGDLAAGAALSLSNPQNIGLWLGIGGGAVAGLGASRHQPLTVFFAAFMLACVLWCVFLGSVLSAK